MAWFDNDYVGRETLNSYHTVMHGDLQTERYFIKMQFSEFLFFPRYVYSGKFRLAKLNPFISKRTFILGK